MSKKNKSGYIFSGNDKKSKKINKAQAAGSTVEKPKKHLHIFGEKEHMGPVDRTLDRSIHADRHFIKKWGHKTMNAQKREDFVERIKNGQKFSIGGIFSKASSAIGNIRTERKAKRELEQTAYKEARKSARHTWDKFIKPRNAAERAVQFDD